MSIVVENYKDQPEKLGYFRIGDVALAIPPEDIVTSRVENADELTTLRAKYPMILKSGQARLDVTVSWKALVTSRRGVLDYSQWEDLRRVLAIFKSAPFTEVENEHLRALLVKKDAAYDTERMTFGLRQLRVDTIPDIIDGLQVTLTMTLFNFSAYSNDFAYRGFSANGSEVGVDASHSPQFKDYIDRYIQENLDSPIDGSNKFLEWRDNNNGDLGFRWNTYVVQPRNTAQPAKASDGTTLDPSIWTFDYMTDRSKFFFKENSLQFSDDGFDNSTAVHTTGLSVAFTNNLAQIPLCNYQYPTYQHVGPGTTMVSIAFANDNPDARGLGAITSMVDELNSQFMKLRTEARKVSSIHRMQAIFIDNQILNMLGVFSILPKGFNTETLRESSVIQASLMGVQYENMFETKDGYRMKNPSLSYNEALRDTVSDNTLIDSLSEEEKNRIFPVVEFQTNRVAQDKSYLRDKITRIDDASRQAVKTMPNLPMPAGIDGSQAQLIYQVLDFKVPNSAENPLLPILPVPTTRPGVIVDNTAFSSKLFSDLYPDINARRQSPPSYTDFFILKSIALKYNLPLPSGVLTLTDKVDKQANKSDPIPAYYDWLFLSMANTDKFFKNALEDITRSPKFRDKFHKAVAQRGPGTDPANEGHGAYRDLGLKSQVQDPEDFNPGFYFVDYGKQLYAKMWEEMAKGKPSPFGDIFNASNELNKPKERGGVVTSTVKVADPIGDSVFGTMIRSSVPGYSMASAFPTFKLFLMEDDNSSIYYAYDDFYSYSSVLDIEVIRYTDKPDVAMLQITNLAGLLTHKLFDNSTQGRREAFFSNLPHTIKSDTGEAVNNPGGIATQADGSRDIQGNNYSTALGSTDDPDSKDIKKVPLKYYALQTGSKIQVRMGFSDNPDKLWPIFTGQVTQIEEEAGLITLMAQSYMLELCDNVDEDLKTDGWGFASIGESIDEHAVSPIVDMLTGEWTGIFRDLFSAPVPRGKAYSGYALWGTSGETDEVIKDLIKVSAARHFGHWQIFQGGDLFIKGFRWEKLLGEAVSAFGFNTAGAALASLNDRSGENILINHFISANGDRRDGTIASLARPASFEKPTVILPAKYSIPGQNKQPPWTYIRDVSRRYPEYNLLVKQYGYPYGADATLIFAHPHDWYYSRLPLLGEQEMEIPNDQRDQNAFKEWWTSIGATRFHQEIGPLTSEAVVQAMLAKINAQVSYEVFYTLLNTLRDEVTNSFLGKLSDISRALGIFPGAQQTSPFFGPTVTASQARTAIKSLISEAQYTIASMNGGTLLRSNASSRVQPVRRFHFIDQKMIVYNGIKINDQIFNTVRVGEENIPICEFIPSHHRRLLDCNPSIVNPDENINGAGCQNIRMCYAQSFLREEASKMYTGEIVLRGAPEIEPSDVLVILDPSTGMAGPVVVDSVIHSFNQEQGYITIVRPRTLVLVNEAATASVLSRLTSAIITAGAQIQGFSDEWRRAGSIEKGVEASKLGSSAVLGTGLIALFGGAGALVNLVLGIKVIAGMVNKSSRINPLIIVPVMRYGRPWFGGVEGYRIGDYAELVFDETKQFVIDEIRPLIDSARTAYKILNPSLSDVAQQPAIVPKTAPGGLVNTTRPVGVLNTESHAITGTSALDRWAEAIRIHEGAGPRTRSTRNNNPGNLKGRGTAGSENGFARFNTWQEGVDALKQDLKGKIRKYPNYTILQIMTRYLGGDPNNPRVTSEGDPFAYANSVASHLGVPVDTQLQNLG